MQDNVISLSNYKQTKQAKHDISNARQFLRVYVLPYLTQQEHTKLKQLTSNPIKFNAYLQQLTQSDSFINRRLNSVKIH